MRHSIPNSRTTSAPDCSAWVRRLNSSRGLNSVFFPCFRRGFAAVQGAPASSSVKTSAALKRAGEETVKSVEKVSSWGPDPKTGYYRPENAAAEIDVAELRAALLKHRHWIEAEIRLNPGKRYSIEGWRHGNCSVRFARSNGNILYSNLRFYPRNEGPSPMMRSGLSWSAGAQGPAVHVSSSFIGVFTFSFDLRPFVWLRVQLQRRFRLCSFFIKQILSRTL